MVLPVLITVQLHGSVAGVDVLHVIPVGVGVAILVPHSFQEREEARGQDGAEQGPEPVDPVVAGEAAGYDGGAEGAGGVEGAAG